jgi:hypothetical protein
VDYTHNEGSSSIIGFFLIGDMGKFVSGKILVFRVLVPCLSWDRIQIRIFSDPKKYDVLFVFYSKQHSNIHKSGVKCLDFSVRKRVCA